MTAPAEWAGLPPGRETIVMATSREGALDTLRRLGIGTRATIVPSARHLVGMRLSGARVFVTMSYLDRHRDGLFDAAAAVGASVVELLSGRSEGDDHQDALAVDRAMVERVISALVGLLNDDYGIRVVLLKSPSIARRVLERLEAEEQGLATYAVFDDLGHHRGNARAPGPGQAIRAVVGDLEGAAGMHAVELVFVGGER